MSIGSAPDMNDLAFLKGAELIQVAVGEFQIQLNFFGAIGIYIECSLTIDGARFDGNRFTGNAAASTLLAAIGKKIKAIHITDQFELNVQFDSGPSVTLHTNSDGTESYQVRGPSGLWVF